MNDRPSMFNDAWREFGGRLLIWDIRGPNANESAHQVLELVRKLQNSARRPGSIFLTSIALEIEQGLFPDLLAALVREPEWDYSHRFYLSHARKDVPTPTVTIGQITFEDDGFLGRVLALDGGIRWGAALTVAGVQVEEASVPNVISQSILDTASLPSVLTEITLAWRATANLDRLIVWDRHSALNNFPIAPDVIEG